MTLDPALARSILLVASFRGTALDSVQAFMLMLALKLPTIDAGQVPSELLQGSKTLCGIATASLLSQNLLEVCGRVRSSSALANGRKVNQLRVPNGRANTVRTWLAIRGYEVETSQMELSA